MTQEQMPLLVQSWWPPPVFTDYAKNALMPSVATNLGCYRELEHKRIDVVFKASVGRADSSHNKVVVAIELENVFGKSHEEVAKLRDFEVPLCVLITYARAENHQHLLSGYAEIMSAPTKQGQEADSRELLVIFGPYGKKPPKNLTWHHFVYRERKFCGLGI